jgi:hypothetical protein
MLRNIWKLLDDQGVLLLTVPAHASLWSYFDEAGGHCRRYELEELHMKLEETGYRIEYMTQFMATVHPLIWLSRKTRAKSVNGTDKELLQGELQIIPGINELISWLLMCESKWLAKRRHLPFGASLLAVARKGSAK